MGYHSMTHTEKVKFGWSYHGVVRMHKMWCIMCTKSRWHETVANKTLCLACLDVTDEVVETLSTEDLEVAASCDTGEMI